MRWRATGTDAVRGRWWVEWTEGAVTGTAWVISELYDRCSDRGDAEQVLLELIRLAGWARRPPEPPAPAS